MVRFTRVMTGEDLTRQIIDEDAYLLFEVADPVGPLCTETQCNIAFQITEANRDTLVLVLGDARETCMEFQDAQSDHVNEILSCLDSREVNKLTAQAQAAAIAASLLAAQSSASASVSGSAVESVVAMVLVLRLLPVSFVRSLPLSFFFVFVFVS